MIILKTRRWIRMRSNVLALQRSWMGTPFLFFLPTLLFGVHLLDILGWLTGLFTFFFCISLFAFSNGQCIRALLHSRLSWIFVHSRVTSVLAVSCFELLIKRWIVISLCLHMKIALLSNLCWHVWFQCGFDCMWPGYVLIVIVLMSPSLFPSRLLHRQGTHRCQ